ncbi:protein adenylyltransferase SelO [Granulicella arctica]|uniref:protein adenylyltransferase SelO n=1 Tax=Granulicella arctica TaxID=940613 RepID=UPI0021E05091|nr:YdiU family protein [Granulicella arctica]
MSSADVFALVSPVNTEVVTSPVRFNFQNTYVRLPERFYSRVNPTPVAAPGLVKVNEDLARSLGLDPTELSSPEGVAILAGSRVADGSEPLAIAYAGHQFGHFVAQLGDGRANLLGEVMGLDGVRYDLQLKGSGPTPFSRNGDGRASLGSVLREYIVSEAMAALGVPTTRALAAVTTGESIYRETMLPGAVLTRVAASHLRVGTFQYFAARNDTQGVRILADYAIARHYPEAASAKRPYLALLEGVISRHAQLVAQWVLLGFVHGVMNTDNTSISGETIDYGPCAFMEAFDPDMVFSSIDRQGRYAYSNQPRAALWNLTRLAETLLPILDENPDTSLASAKEALSTFDPQFEMARLAGLRRKLGLVTEREGDLPLAEQLLASMAANDADFTLTFRRLSDVAGGSADDTVRTLFADPRAYDSWAAAWRSRLAEEPISAQERAAIMRRANPAFIPRNHRVEAVIEAAVERQDFQPFEEMLDVVSHPYEDRPELERYTTPARPEECVRQTFCGT